MFNSIFGQSSLLGNAQNAVQGHGGLANQYSSPLHNQHLQHQATQYNQALMQNMMGQQQHRYMINGRTMTFDQWLDELAPGEDNSLRSFLILKYRGRNEKS